MSIWRDVWVNVVAGLIGAAIIAALVRAGRFPFLPAVRIGFRMRRAGVSEVFFTRRDYSRQRKRGGDIASYIQSARHSFTYVGFGLGHGIQYSDAATEFRKAISRRVRVCLVLLAPDLEPVSWERLGRYFGTSAHAQESLIAEAWRQFRALYNSLPDAEKPFLELRAHRELLTSSAFILDAGSPEARALVDFKFYARGRDSSFGIELVDAGPDAKLFQIMTKSFEAVRDAALGDKAGAKPPPAASVAGANSSSSEPSP